MDTYLVSRVVFGVAHHTFVVVTNDDGSVRQRYSYAPSKDGSNGDYGSLVSVTGSGNKTDRDDAAAWENRDGAHLPGFHVYNLTDQGYKDDAVVASGNNVNKMLGTPDNPGDTKYNALPDGKNGDGNSNSGAYRVVDGARPQGQDFAPSAPVTPGRENSSNIGTPAPVGPPPGPDHQQHMNCAPGVGCIPS